MSLQGRKTCRAERRCDPTSLAEWIYCAVHHSDRTSIEIAEHLGTTHKKLLAAVDPHVDGVRFRLEWFVPLCRFTGDLAPAEFLAKELACALQKVSCTAGPANLSTALATVFSEVGECAAAAKPALAEGRISVAEERAFLREANEASDALQGLKATMLACALSSQYHARVAVDRSASRSAVSA